MRAEHSVLYKKVTNLIFRVLFRTAKFIDVYRKKIQRIMRSLFAALLLIFPSILVCSQTKELTRVLNQELQNEVRLQKEYPEDQTGDKFEVVRPFHIRDTVLTMVVIKEAPGTKEIVEDKLVATDIKVLSLEVKIKGQDGTYYIQKQEVDLHKIRAIVKDINVIFEADADAVTITRTGPEGERTVNRSDLFFLHLSRQKQNEELAAEIIAAFKKAGHEIEKGAWFD